MPPAKSDGQQQCERKSTHHASAGGNTTDPLTSNYPQPEERDTLQHVHFTKEELQMRVLSCNLVSNRLRRR